MKIEIRNKVLKNVGILLMIVFISTPWISVVNAKDLSASRELERKYSRISEYFQFKDKNVIVYDREQAVADHVDKEILKMADQIYLYGKEDSKYDNLKVEVTGRSDKVTETATSGVPIYGNWCGPGRPPKGKNPPAIDTLDRGCRAHDKCYDKRGYHKCSCDREFLSYIKRNRNKMHGAKEVAASYVIQSWLSVKTSRVTKDGGWFSCRK